MLSLSGNICMFVWKVRACDYVAQNHIIPNKYGANDFLSPCFEVGGIQFGEWIGHSNIVSSWTISHGKINFVVWNATLQALLTGIVILWFFKMKFLSASRTFGWLCILILTTLSLNSKSVCVNLLFKYLKFRRKTAYCSKIVQSTI